MEATARPFLKWAGSKTQLVSILRGLLPSHASRYIEPFVGSGALFLNVRYPSCLLSDLNRDIIRLYSVLKARRERFITRSRRLFIPGNNTAEKFYALREEFNACDDDERRAALFVYLNRHCFNGLCRYNRKGAFNTPFGLYKQVYFPADEMRAFADKLRNATLHAVDFRKALSAAGPGDVIYCDPPYVPLSPTASFTSYAAGGFGEEDQRNLCALATEAAGRGAFVAISNHDTPFTRELYRNATRIIPLMVSRLISCNGKNRNKAGELIAVFESRKRQHRGQLHNCHSPGEVSEIGRT